MNIDSKYWKYKERLNHFFVAIDDYNKQGSNIPSGIRHLWGRNSNLIQWGDSIIGMSYYIMYLATEYEVLKNRNDVKSNTALKDFYLALKSLERLDKVAENAYRDVKKQSGDDLNGFMIRDDVDRDFLNRYPYIKDNDYYGTVSNVTSGFEPFGYKDKKDFTEEEKSKIVTEVSQDQMWHLFLGLSLSKKIFINHTKVDIIIGNRTETVNIPEIIDNMVDRFIQILLKNKGRIINPVTGKYVMRGSDARLFMYGFINAAEKITGKKYKEYKFRFFKKIIFKTIIKIGEIVYNNIIPFYNKFQKDRNKRIVIKNYSYRCLGIVGDIWITDDIAKYMSEYYLDKDWFVHFPLIYKLIHDKGTITIPKEIIEELLKSAPENGPYNWRKEDGGWSVYNWSSPGLLDCPENRGDDQIDFNGVYNGIDYLLLYNLYKLTYR